MRKIRSKWLSIILIAALLLGCIQGKGYGLSSVHAEENEKVKMASTNLMVNDYIGLFVDNTGKFSIGTTGGNPENKRDDN